MFLCLIYCEVVLADVAFEEASGVPFFFVYEQGVADAYAADLLFAEDFGEVFACDAFALHYFGCVIPFFGVVLWFWFEYFVECVFWKVGLAVDKPRVNVFFFEFAVKYGFGDGVSCENLILEDEGGRGRRGFGAWLYGCVGFKLCDWDAYGARSYPEGIEFSIPDAFVYGRPADTEVEGRFGDGEIGFAFEDFACVPGFESAFFGLGFDAFALGRVFFAACWRAEELSSEFRGEGFSAASADACCLVHTHLASGFKMFS